MVDHHALPWSLLGVLDSTPHRHITHTLHPSKTKQNRDHYREPTRKPAAAAGAAAAAAASAEQLTSEVAAKEDFWAALDVMLGRSLEENDAARVRRAFAKVKSLCMCLLCSGGGRSDGLDTRPWLNPSSNRI